MAEHEKDGSTDRLPESVRVTLADYMADSRAVMKRALDQEVVVVKPNGDIALIVAGKVEPLK